MNLEQALEVATEYCWRNFPSYIKDGYLITDFKLIPPLKQIITDSFDRMLATWDADNIAPKDIHFLIESWVILQRQFHGSSAFQDSTLVRV